MPTAVDREEVGRLIDEGGQLVEVLPRAEYEEEHLPGAIHIPLKTLNRKTTADLRPDLPVIVYCHDSQWDMSPRAAWRLESLGFSHVYDYVAGKMDWLANGLLSEGARADEPRAGDLARPDVPTCQLSDSVGALQARLQAAGWDQCVVVNEQRIVLGRLRLNDVEANQEAVVETVMEAGPTTIRPNTTLESITERMQARNVDDILVTTAEGRLVGVLYRQDAEQRVRLSRAGMKGSDTAGDSEESS